MKKQVATNYKDCPPKGKPLPYVSPPAPPATTTQQVLMQISERIATLHKELHHMALTLAEVKANLLAAEQRLDASLTEIKGEIAVLQQNGVSQATLDEFNQVASNIVDKSQALSDLIPNTAST